MGVISELLKCDSTHWWVHTGVSTPSRSPKSNILHHAALLFVASPQMGMTAAESAVLYGGFPKWEYPAESKGFWGHLLYLTCEFKANFCLLVFMSTDEQKLPGTDRGTSVAKQCVVFNWICSFCLFLICPFWYILKACRGNKFKCSLIDSGVTSPLKAELISNITISVPSLGWNS